MSVSPLNILYLTDRSDRGESAMIRGVHERGMHVHVFGRLDSPYVQFLREQGIDVWKAKAKFGLSLLREGKAREFVQRLAGRTPATPPRPPMSAPTPPPDYLDDLAVPDGAIDQFHFFHPTQALVEQWLGAAGLQLVKTRLFAINHVFLQAQPAHVP